MGWTQSSTNAHGLDTAKEQTPGASVLVSLERDQLYPAAPLDLRDEDLPYIAPDLISSKSKPGRLAIKGKTASDLSRKDWWIVINNIVYDCTDFILEHPGGEQVIMSFIGEDCSWQFKRFHSRRILEEIAHPLRIGRTEGVKNRFKEPKRRIGLSSLGDEW